MQSPNSHNAQDSHFDPNVSNEDFIEQMLNTIPSSSSWPDLMINNNNNSNKNNHHPSDHLSDDTALHYDHHDQSAAILASKLRQHQINGDGDSSASAAKMMLMQQQHMMLMPRGGGGGGLADNNNNMLHMPLGMNGHNQGGGDGSVQALFNGLSASLHGAAAQHFNHPQSFSAATSLTGSTMNQSQASGSTTGAPQQPRQQRVRARRGQATDPHSIAERLRRERIAERMKSLQELVPNANKTDKASMLDEIIDYVKFLQLQVKVLSMSRLGGAAAMAPLVADMSSEGNGGDCIQASANAGSLGSSRSANGNNQTASSNNNDNLNMTEHQVAKLMEEDMGQAMQYLQGKGLCLMPISLATAISTSTASRNRNNLMIHSSGGGDCPTSPNMSVMTVQSASMANGGGGDGSVKDATSVSKS